MIGKKKHKQVPRTIYPADKAHKYSIGVKGYNKSIEERTEYKKFEFIFRKDFTVARTPGTLKFNG